MAEKKPKKIPVGVLFIHGIGKQAQGETLLGYSEPLFRWIERWIDKPFRESSASNSTSDHDKSSIQVLDTDLGPSDGSPAHSQWLLRVKQGDEPLKESRWLLAEAWWTETFTPSGLRQTVLWALEVAPLMVLLHFTSLSRRVLRKRRRSTFSFLASLLLIPLYVPLAIFAAFVIECVALLVLVLSLVPWIFRLNIIRDVLTGIQSIISNWVGDIHIRTTSPIQRAAMVSKVKSDLRWLEERCDEIAIVAHSQGSAIAYEILQEYKPKSVKRFVTLGSAIKLLSLLEDKNTKFWYRLAIVFINIILPLFILGMGPKLVQSIDNFYIEGRGFFDADAFFILAAGIGGIVLLVTLFWRLGEALNELAVRNPLEGAQPLGLDENFKWVDLYASSDPASNGGFVGKLPAFIESHEVYNHANLFTDHTTYWKNMDEFVTAIFCAINGLAKIRFEKLTNDVINEAKWRRKWRVNILTWGRNLVMVCSAVLLWTAATHSCPSIIVNTGQSEADDNSCLVTVGNLFATSLKKAIPKPPSTEPLSVGAIHDFIAGLENSGQIVVVGGILMLTLPLIWYWLAGLVWHAWGNFETDRFFKGEARKDNDADFGGLGFIFSIMFGFVLVLSTLGYSLVSIIPSFANTPGLFWSERNDIFGGMLYVSVVSFILGAIFYDRNKWPSVTLWCIISSAPIIIGLEINRYSSLKYWLGFLLLIILVTTYHKFFGSRGGIGPRLGQWLSRIKDSVSRENEETDENFPILRNLAARMLMYSQAIAVFAMGLVALVITWRPIESRAVWMNELFIECIFFPWSIAGILIGVQVLLKGANSPKVKPISLIGIGMLILSYLLILSPQLSAWLHNLYSNMSKLLGIG